MEEQAMYLPASVVNALPTMVKNELGRLSADKQQSFLEEYHRKEKSTLFAYLLWFLLGWHYAYQRRWGIQLLFWFTGGGFLLWWLIDLFRIPGMISNYNKDKAVEIMESLKNISR